MGEIRAAGRVQRGVQGGVQRRSRGVQNCAGGVQGGSRGGPRGSRGGAGGAQKRSEITHFRPFGPSPLPPCWRTLGDPPTDPCRPQANLPADPSPASILHLAKRTIKCGKKVRRMKDVSRTRGKRTIKRTKPRKKRRSRCGFFRRIFDRAQLTREVRGWISGVPGHPPEARLDSFG